MVTTSGLLVSIAGGEPPAKKKTCRLSKSSLATLSNAARLAALDAERKWKAEPITVNTLPFNGVPGPINCPPKLTPLDAFRIIFPIDLVSILMAMSINKKPALDDHWSQDLAKHQGSTGTHHAMCASMKALGHGKGKRRVCACSSLASHTQTASSCTFLLTRMATCTTFGSTVAPRRRYLVTADSYYGMLSMADEMLKTPHHFIFSCKANYPFKPHTLAKLGKRKGAQIWTTTTGGNQTSSRPTATH